MLSEIINRPEYLPDFIKEIVIDKVITYTKKKSPPMGDWLEKENEKRKKRKKSCGWDLPFI